MIYEHDLLGLTFIFQTAAEYNRRGEKFFKELDFVIADVVWPQSRMIFWACLPHV